MAGRPGTVLACALLAGCGGGGGGGLEIGSWPMWSFDESGSRASPAETPITVETVGSLARAWSIDGPGVTGTPVVVDEVVYFGQWDGSVTAASARDGTTVWSTDTGDAPSDASVAVTADRVYAAAGAELIALERATGAIVWRTVLDTHPFAHIFSSPTVIDDLIVIGVASTELVQSLDDYTFRGAVVGLSAADGAERWRFYTTSNDATSGAGVSVWSSASVDRALGLAYIGTGNTYEEPASPHSDSILAIRYATGEIAWERQFTENDVYTVFAPMPIGPDADVGAMPNLFDIDGRAVVGVGDKAGIYSVLDRATGETVWSVQLTDGSPLGGIMVASAYAAGVIYVTSNRWEMVDPLFGENPGNVAVAFALDARDGHTLWMTELPDPSFGAVSLAAGVVYVTTVRGILLGLDAATGAELWRDDHGGDGAAGGIAIAGGLLVAGHGFSLFKAPRQVSGGLQAYTLP